MLFKLVCFRAAGGAERPEQPRDSPYKLREEEEEPEERVEIFCCQKCVYYLIFKMSRTYNDELQYLDKIHKNCWRIKKGFVPNMQVKHCQKRKRVHF